MFDNEYFAEAGENFYNFIMRIKRTMKERRQTLSYCTFNDIVIMVNELSLIDDLCTIYDLKCELRRIHRV